MLRRCRDAARVRAVRIFIWHGYLLTGTGSNEYSQALARTLGRQGHDVTVFCQDPDAATLDLAGARVVRPVLPGPLPVFVLDRYAQAQPALLPDLPRDVLDDFVAANVAAIRAAGPADLLITNHLLMGGPVGAASGLPFVVKAHGSELEYAMRGNQELCDWARDTLTDALAVIAGSQHIERVVEDLVGIDPRQIHVIPPGVDTDTMRPRPAGRGAGGPARRGRARSAQQRRGPRRAAPRRGQPGRIRAVLRRPRPAPRGLRRQDQSGEGSPAARGGGPAARPGDHDRRFRPGAIGPRTAPQDPTWCSPARCSIVTCDTCGR